MDFEEIASVVGEFSLEDTYDHLTEVEKDLEFELDKLMITASNNPVQTLHTATEELIASEQCRFAQSLIKHLRLLDLRSQPMNDTSDLYKQTIQELENEVRKMDEIETSMMEELQGVKDSIIHLENEKNGLQKMKEACIGAIEDVANSTYDAEITLASRLFARVKKDLGDLVASTTLTNEDFQDLLSDLTLAYMKGGNEVYIDVEDKSFDCVHFLIEADVAVYHRNDKKKVRLMDLL